MTRNLIKKCIYKVKMNKIEKFIKKKNRSKLICLTAYSKNIANIIDKHCDLTLVGDSLGSVLYSFASTMESQ